jgi:hypothetical protein
MIAGHDLPAGQTIPLDFNQVVECVRTRMRGDKLSSSRIAEATGVDHQIVQLFRRGATLYPRPAVMNAFIQYYLPGAKLIIPEAPVAPVTVSE